jgi:hypothetical protein
VQKRRFQKTGLSPVQVWLGRFRTPLFYRQSTQLHEWHQHTAVAIMLGNVKVASSCVDEIKLVTCGW